LGEVSIYCRDPLGQLIELACYKFVPPAGVTPGEVLLEAHRRRVAEGAHHITDAHVADALALLAERTRPSLSAEREAKRGD
jgi:hypothetical protein